MLAQQVPLALTARQGPARLGNLSAAAPRLHSGTGWLTEQRISDATEHCGPGLSLPWGHGRRPRFSGIARAAVKQKQQQTARTPQAPAKPPVTARDVIIAVDDTDDAQQAVEWAVGNVLKGGTRSAVPGDLSTRLLLRVSV